MRENFSPRLPLLLLGDHPEELTPKIHLEFKKITGAADEFRQVFLNLFLNMLDAMPGEGNVHDDNTHFSSGR